MLEPGRLRRFGDVLGLSLLLLAREVLPEVRDAVDAVRARERLLEALDVVEIGLDDFGALRGEGLGLVLARIARDGAAREAAGRIRQNRADEAAALRAGRA